METTTDDIEILLDQGRYNECIEVIDLQIDSIPKEDFQHLSQLLFLQGLATIRVGDTDKTSQLIQQIDLLSEIWHSSFIHIKGQVLQGYHLKSQGKYSEAEEILLKVEQINFKDPTAHPDYHLVMGHLYNCLASIVSLSDLKLSNTYYYRALDHHNQSGSQLDIASTIANIGNNYNNLGKLDKSLESYAEAYDIFYQLGNLTYCAGIYNNIANTYKKKGEVDHSLTYFKQSLELYKQEGIIEDIAMVYHNIGNVYHMIGDYDTALTYVFRAYDIRHEIDSTLALTHSLFEIIHIMINFDQDPNQIQLYLEEFSTLSTKLSEDWVDDRYLLIKAIWLKNQEEIIAKAKALMILDDLMESNSLNNHELEILLIVTKCELLLMELKVTNSSDKIKHVKELTEQLEVLGTDLKLYSLIIETNILKAKLMVLENEIVRANRLLEASYNFAISHNLGNLTHRVRFEQKIIATTIKQWSHTIEDQQQLNHRMNDIGILRPKNKLNHFIVASNRLPILLALLHDNGSTFATLKDITGFSSTKLSKQLTKLIDHNYISTKSTFIDAKPTKLYYINTDTMNELKIHRDYIETYADIPLLLRNFIHFN